jgi:hypothetical protein
VDPQLREALQITQREMFRFNERFGQAMAWENVDVDGVGVVDKPGGLNNASAYVGLVPDHKVGVILLANRGDFGMKSPAIVCFRHCRDWNRTYQLTDLGSIWLKSARIKFSLWSGGGEFSPRNGGRRSGHIAISAAILHPGANDIPYASHAALEIDHARIIGGSPPAPLRTLGVPPFRHRPAYRRALQRVRAHCRHRVRHALGSPVLKSDLRRFGPTQ